MKKKQTIDTQLVDRAIIFATKAHASAVRKGSSLPYIVHPLEAMAIVATITSDQELMAAALLHDVVENTDFSLDDIRREFGNRVADLVDAETSREIEGVSHVDSWRMRFNYRQHGDRVWERFNEKNPASHAWYYNQLARSLAPLSDTDAYQEFVSLVKQVFSTFEACP